MNLIIIIVFLTAPACYSNSTPSFSFSKKKGLREISSSLNESDEENKNVSVSKKTQENTSSALIESDQAESNKLKVEAGELKVESDELKVESDELKVESNELKVESLEEIPSQSISEDFAPEEPEYIKGTGFLSSLFENSSWFFQKKQSAHKIGASPSYSHDMTEGSRLGFSFFSYSTKEKGYYFNTAFNKYLSHPYVRFSSSLIGNREGLFRSKAKLIYNNHYENYYGNTENPENMQANKNEITRIHAHRFMINYDLSYQELDQNFYFGLGAKFFFRKEITSLQPKQYFSNEAFIFLKAFTGFDTRDNFKDPKKGAFHQISFGCKANLSYSDSFCQGEGDFRFYFPLFEETDFIPFKNSVLALRGFVGSSFISSSYATKYSLGRYSFFQAINTLRGFQRNRFIGDKIYFAQTELRWPIWDKYLQGVVFLELGETAELNQFFKDFAVDYGGGLRFGFPPNYDLKLRLDWGTGRDLQGKRNYDFTVSFLQVF